MNQVDWMKGIILHLKLSKFTLDSCALAFICNERFLLQYISHRHTEIYPLNN